MSPNATTSRGTATSAAVQPVNILSLDGGGIRGISILFILQELMGRIRVAEKLKRDPLPYEYFDLIVGTSTGGLIALMLGRLRMSINEAITAYEDLSHTVFGKGRSSQFKPYYSANVLKGAMEKFSGDTPLVDSEPDICHTAVVAVKEISAADSPDLLRTYSSDAGHLECSISDAARATTAATGFFAPAGIQIKHGLTITYLDGGLGHNNPASLCIEEAREIWGAKCEFRCIVSIGTGFMPNVVYRGSDDELAKRLKQIHEGCRKVHNQMEKSYGGRNGVYFRFDVPTDLNQIGLDEWKKLDDIKQLTHAYVGTESIKFRECIETVLPSQAVRVNRHEVPHAAEAIALEHEY